MAVVSHLHNYQPPFNVSFVFCSDDFSRWNAKNFIQFEFNWKCHVLHAIFSLLPNSKRFIWIENVFMCLINNIYLILSSSNNPLNQKKCRCSFQLDWNWCVCLYICYNLCAMSVILGHTTQNFWSLSFEIIQKNDENVQVQRFVMVEWNGDFYTYTFIWIE